MKTLKLLSLATVLFFFNALHAQTPNFDWVRKSSNVNITATTTDPAGNLFTSGFYAGTVDFGPGSGVPVFGCSGQTDMVIAKRAHNGQLSWVRHFGGLSYEQANGLVTDAYGNVYVTGFFNDTVDFGPGPGITELYSMNDNTFVLKLDSLGNLVWVKQISSLFENYANSIAISDHNELVITGLFGGNTDFNPGSGIDTLNSIARAMYVLKLDTAGNFIWVKQITSQLFGSSISSCIADHAGNIVAVGRLIGTIDLDPGAGVFNLAPLSGTTSSNFILKWDANGNFKWGHKLDNVDLSLYNGSLLCDSANNYYMGGGALVGTINLDLTGGVHNITTTVDNYRFVMKVDSDAHFNWVQQMSDVKSIALDKSGNVYACGTSLRKYQTDGTAQWIIDSSLSKHITICRNSDIYITGYFSGTVDFNQGSGVDTLSGTNDVFYLKLSQPVLAVPGISIRNASPFTVYPNPNNGSFIINCSEDEDYVITNQLGQIVKSITTQVGQTGLILVEGLPIGYYIITSKNCQSVKVLVSQ